MTPTGEIQFGTEKTGLFVNDDDCKQYYAALYTVLMGRNDPISYDAVQQLLELLREADDDEVGQVHRLKPFDACLADGSGDQPGDGGTGDRGSAARGGKDRPR